MWQPHVHLPTSTAPSNIQKLSKIFQPISVIPKNAIIKHQDVMSKSQRLMMELGVIKQANPGSFHFLPMGIRALEKLIKLVDHELSKIEAQKVMFPILTNTKLWKATGRLESVGSELFKLKDRHDQNYILSPTHEEAVSDLLASIGPVSYKAFPLRLYQVTSKFRDEMKPRFGLIRGKQFLMKDLYSFDVSRDEALRTYEEVCECYDRIFQRIGVEFVKVSGTSGAMGGSLSHEYHYKADIGEDRLVTCNGCGYAANVQLSGNEKCAHCGSSQNLEISTGIEVGHTFFLGERYSHPLKVHYLTSEQKPAVLQMGSYGLGLSRILAAVIEVLSLEQEMRWPQTLAPYTVLIIPPKEGSKEEQTTSHFSEKLYNSLETLSALQGNVLVDDRLHLTIGRRLLDARRFGYPLIVVIGKQAMEQQPLFEINNLENNKQLFLTENNLLSYIHEIVQ